MSRREQSQSLLITGPAGSGKSALVKAALQGLDAEVIYLAGTPLGRHGAFETAINAIATFEQSETLGPIRDQLAGVVAHAHTAQPSPVEVARAIVQLMRMMPPRERAAVVVFEDVHLYDDHSLQALAYFARQNHLYDQPYLITARSTFDLPNFEGIEQLRLAPLSDQAAQVCLSRWSDTVVPYPVVTALNAMSGGNPRILREVGP